MPFALLLVGLVLVITGARGTYGAFGRQLKADFTGQGNFVYWIVAIGIVGAVGYVKELEKPSRMFLALVLISFTLSNRGVFAKLTEALQKGPTAPSSVTPAPSGDLSSGSTGTTSAVPDSSAQANFKTTVNVAKTFFAF